MDVVIYHNPRCSKSRQTLELLISRDLSPEIIEYLHQPLDEEALREILSRLNISARELMRHGEAEYKAHGLDDPALSDDELIVDASLLKTLELIRASDKTLEFNW